MRAAVLSKPNCEWCVKAKDLLSSKNISYSEFDVLTSEETEYMFLTCGFVTVPQIFIDGKHIGGYSDLYAFLNGED